MAIFRNFSTFVFVIVSIFTPALARPPCPGVAGKILAG